MAITKPKSATTKKVVSAFPARRSEPDITTVMTGAGRRAVSGSGACCQPVSVPPTTRRILPVSAIQMSPSM